MRSAVAAVVVAALASVTSAHAIPGKRELATVYTKCTNPNTVAITFDDGPFMYEEELMGVLANYSAVATFFLNGNNWACIYDEKPAASVKALYDAGHELASHTFTHMNMSDPAISWDKMHRDMYLMEQALVKITGAMPALLRPPYGAYNDRALSAIAHRNMSAIIWDWDSEDSLGKNGTEIKARYDDIIAKKPANILTLNHSVQKITVKESMPYALDKLKQAGYTFVKVSECLGIEPYQFVQEPAARDATWKCT
ncbi:carbohydrate esterase family 4 protein [Auriculariales sp. MPI-PUGE-AT-0066]|nr:carbohydrate esterase family 4 protein [Auriculariales sp. MPI-PUGE-AT-0066]